MLRHALAMCTETRTFQHMSAALSTFQGYLDQQVAWHEEFRKPLHTDKIETHALTDPAEGRR